MIYDNFLKHKILCYKNTSSEIGYIKKSNSAPPHQKKLLFLSDDKGK